MPRSFNAQGDRHQCFKSYTSTKTSLGQYSLNLALARPPPAPVLAPLNSPNSTDPKAFSGPKSPASEAPWD